MFSIQDAATGEGVKEGERLLTFFFLFWEASCSNHEVQGGGTQGQNVGGAGGRWVHPFSWGRKVRPTFLVHL